MSNKDKALPGTVRVYGASDDLIEVDGDIREEFGAYGTDDDGPLYLAFSDGTLATIRYGADEKGYWRIFIHREGAAKSSLRQATDEDTDYSDILTLTGDVKWVVCGPHLAKKAGAKS
jgi:hypothetical protein